MWISPTKYKRKEFLRDRHVFISFSNSHLRNLHICHVDIISYGKREVLYQVGLEPHKVHTKFHKNVSPDFRVEVAAVTQRRDDKVCFFHFRNDNRPYNGYMLKFMPQVESEHLLPVSRKPYFVLW